MVLVPSSMVALGTPAPDFALPDTEGATVRLRDFQGTPLLIAFMCNHCPYVKHIAHKLADVTAAIAAKGIAVVGINANDAENYPDDAPPMMRAERRIRGYTFPYLYDEGQQIARAYDAQCTPDFFLYDAGHRLVYRGQFDDSRPGNMKPVTGADLMAAVESLLAGKGPVQKQMPSMGCNIKWRK